MRDLFASLFPTTILSLSVSNTPIASDPATSAIFDHILKYLCDEAATRTDPLESRKAFITLKSLSVVCKHFRRRLSPRIFRRIRFWSFDNRIYRLASVLENNPTLALHVEELITLLGSLERIPTKVLETLLHFPSLKSLTVNTAAFYHQDLAFHRKLIERYLSSEKLTSLGLTETSHVPLTAILSCPHLETLRLDDFDFDNLELSEPSSTIKHLYIGEGVCRESFPLSFLSYFPFLVTLEIEEDFNAERPSLSFSYEPEEDAGPPSFNLEKLHLNPGSIHNIYPVLDFYLDHAKKQGVKAFQSLKNSPVAPSCHIKLDPNKDNWCRSN
ncbi:hypothetical protein BJ165DRAFT_1530638 [Panaeolus papilionaceus]|nr:hypothetical protein BJ165DRAFT_1530638 [Panaeolus papilionaceus]